MGGTFHDNARQPMSRKANKEVRYKKIRAKQISVILRVQSSSSMEV